MSRRAAPCPSPPLTTTTTDAGPSLARQQFEILRAHTNREGNAHAPGERSAAHALPAWINYSAAGRADLASPD